MPLRLKFRTGDSALCRNSTPKAGGQPCPSTTTRTRRRLITGGRSVHPPTGRDSQTDGIADLFPAGNPSRAAAEFETGPRTYHQARNKGR